jgi:LPS sulfotransferase NodH
MAPRGYAICAEPRSGSSLLCAALRSTGVLGQPREYLGMARFALLEKEPELLDRLLQEASTPNRVYGLKVMASHFDIAAGSNWASRLPELQFIHIERRDLLGQAISWLRAEQTGQFHSRDPGSGTAHYDGRRIAGMVRRLGVSQLRWRLYFARNGISPLLLTYEEFADDLGGAARRVAAHVGLAEEPVVAFEGLRLGRQRDALSEEWRERFIREFRDLDRFEHPAGRWRVWLRRRGRGRLKDLARTVGRWLPA